MIFSIILYILFAHFVSDFVMQTHEMATQKSTSIKWLTRHIISYGFGLFILSVVFVIISILCGNNCIEYTPRILLYIGLNMGLHWVTDYFTSKETSRLWGLKKVHDFFVMIGFDQFLHQASLLITFYLIFL